MCPFALILEYWFLLSWVSGRGRSAADPDATPSLPIKTAPVSAEEGDRLVAANDIPPGAIREDAILAM